jgi:UV DNA damage repair endonuclease
MNPAFGAVLATIPAAKSIMEQVIRVFRFPDRQSILGSESQNVFDVMQQQQDQQRMMQEMLLDPRMQVAMALGGGGGMGMQQQLPAGQPEQAPPQQVPAA